MRSVNLLVDAIEQEFAEAEDRVERCAQLMADVGQELRLVPAGVLKALVELLKALARRVDVLRERAEFVAVGHRDLLRKVSGCNAIEPLVDLLHRRDNRPGYGVAERQRQDEARRARTRRPNPRRFVCRSGCIDPVHHVRLGPLTSGSSGVEPVGERRELGVLDLLRFAVRPSRVSSSTRVAMAMKREYSSRRRPSSATSSFATNAMRSRS